MNLSHQHFRAIELLLSGVSVPEAANQLGLHPNTIRRWLQNPEFRAQLEDSRQAAIEAVNELVQARLRDEAPRSLETITTLRDGARRESVRLAAAQDLLDRAGFRAPTRHVHAVANFVVTPELIEAMRSILAESPEQLSAGDMIDVLPERS